MKIELINKIKKLGFESKFFGFPPWKYSVKEDTRFYLFLEEFKIWLMVNYNININICHRMHSQTYYFYITGAYNDKNDNLYEEKYSKYKTYRDALPVAINCVFEYCSGYLIKNK